MYVWVGGGKEELVYKLVITGVQRKDSLMVHVKGRGSSLLEMHSTITNLEWCFFQ